MKKRILFLLLPILTISIANAESEKLIGGFGAPMFFKEYDQAKIDQICKVKNVAQVKIDYPRKLTDLANKITHKIKYECKFKVKQTELKLVDTPTLKYRHDAVIVTVYFTAK